MNIHEFGRENKQVIILIHPSIVRWDYFEYVIPLLEKKYHLIIPALPGYDPDTASDFTGVEQIAAELEAWLTVQGISEISCIYGCSMGGSIVLRFLAFTKLHVSSAVIDGGITPYQLPYLLTRMIAVRDFLMIYCGKLGGPKLLEKAFSADAYSEEDLRYASDVLAHMSALTVWRTFESANNYAMPEQFSLRCGNIEYWYSQAEEKDRKWDIEYMKKHVPETIFRKFEETGHGGLAVLQPERFASETERVCAQGHQKEKE